MTSLQSKHCTRLSRKTHDKSSNVFCLKTLIVQILSFAVKQHLISSFSFPMLYKEIYYVKIIWTNKSKTLGREQIWNQILIKPSYTTKMFSVSQQNPSHIALCSITHCIYFQRRSTGRLKNRRSTQLNSIFIFCWHVNYVTQTWHCLLHTQHHLFMENDENSQLCWSLKPLSHSVQQWSYLY